MVVSASKRLEDQAVHEEEHIFKVCMRRNRMLGMWLAGIMGLKDEAAFSYAEEVIESDFERPGFDDVVEKVMKDLNARNIDLDEREIRLQAEKFFHLAHEEIMRGI